MSGKLSAAVALLLLAAAAHAEPAKPSPLLIDGKPIDPTCLMSLTNGDSSWSDPIDLKKCHATDIVIQPGKTEPGMIGFIYTDKDDPSPMNQPYFYYRYLGQYGGHSLLFLDWGGGGSGEFTGLTSVDRNGSQLKPLDNTAGGDRCNGGLSNASLVGGKLTYDANITPYDLIALAKPSTKLDAYKDLEASAASCVAVVHYADKEWKSVTLTSPDWADQSGWTEQYKYQHCFNGLYHDHIVRKETELDYAGVTAFAKAFANACVKKT